MRDMRSSAALASLLVGMAFGVHWPAFVQDLQPGEQRYNSALYKGSHNSYSRDESLAVQIDDYNVWQIELDINEYQLKAFVTHDCGPPSDNDDTLETLLQRLINESRTFSQKFTMIYLDVKSGSGSVCQWTLDLPGHLKRAFTQILGTHIYPAKQFVQQDASQWPSYQALVRRGFNWGVIVDWHGHNPTPSDDLFFYATEDNPPISSASPAAVPSENTVLVNIDGGCDASPTGSQPMLRDGRWLYRAYPGGGCFSDCTQMNGNYWANLVQKRYNYIATNCVDWDHTFAAETHSPQPLFVDASANITCPHGYSSCEWGTSRYPFHDLGAAISRADPVTTIRLKPGEYQLSTPARAAQLDRPMTYVDDGPGPAVIR